MRPLCPLVRARAAQGVTAPERRRLGAEALSLLRAEVEAVTALLPELRALPRFASRPTATALVAGWHAPGPLAETPRVTLEAAADHLVVAWGFGRPGRSRETRDRHVAEGMRRRRALGEALAWRLGALRAEGARLYARRGDEAELSEDEWLRAPAGAVVFRVHEAALAVDALATRRVADHVARLVGLGAALGSFVLEPSPAAAPTLDSVREAARALRWDERSLGEGAAPAGLVPIGRRVAWDPVSGWFVPEGTAHLDPASAPRARLLLELGVVASGRLPGVTAPVGLGLHTRLARWLASRGSAPAQRDVSHLEVVVADRALPSPGAPSPLEALVAGALEDPSGDTAAAIAGLLAGAPWTVADPLDPPSVAARVHPRWAASAARGVARLVERGLLARGVTGSLDAVGECLTHPALRPVLALAVERALGSLEVFPQASRARDEAARARPWELVGAAPRAATLETLARRFVAWARASGLVFDLDLVRCFVVGLAARPFAVLTGVSGTGKTALARSFAAFVTGGAEARVAVVPVRPDWLDSRGVLGYLNALRGDGAYEDTPALRVMLRAAEHPDEAHFLVLDEMNLARVEHYLAEVLSAMESGAPVPLHGRANAVPTTDGARRVPPSFTLPPNLFVVGTINLDDTTHPLSAKVYDRAWVWEFEPAAPTSLLRDWLGDRRVVPAATDDERRAFMEAPLLDDPVRAVVLAMGRDGAGARLDRLFAAMATGGRPFGYRVATEVLRFAHLCEREGLEVPPAWRLDRAVLGKVLPRLSGARRELEPVLRALLAVCEGAEPARTSAAGVADGAMAPREAQLSACAARLREMLARLERDGWASFTR